MTADVETFEEHGIQPPPWVEKSYLEKALRQGLKLHQLTIKSYRINPATVVGDNYASQMFRVSFEIIKTSSSAPEKLSVVMKTNPLGKAGDMLDGLAIFDKEAEMLQDILPDINKMLHRIDPLQQPLSAKCLYFSKNPDNIIILEDLCELGFANADRMNGLDISLANVALESLGKYHAASLAVYEKTPEKFENFQKSIWMEEHKELLVPMITSSLDGLMEAVSTWKDFPQAQLELLTNLKSTIHGSLWESSKFDPNEINVLTHGDCWINNFMFSSTEGKVNGFRFVDFQLSCLNSAALDLNYFIFTSPNSSIRLEKINEMLSTYYNAFMATIKSLNVTLPRSYTLEELKSNFKKRLFFGFIATFLIYPITVCPKDDAPDVNDLLEENEKSKSFLFQSETFKKVFKASLPYFIENGAFNR